MQIVFIGQLSLNKKRIADYVKNKPVPVLTFHFDPESLQIL